MLNRGISPTSPCSCTSPTAVAHLDPIWLPPNKPCYTPKWMLSLIFSLLVNASGQKNIKSSRLCSMEQAWLRFSSSSTAKVTSSFEVGSMCFLQCSLLCSWMNLILVRGRERERETSAKDDATEIFLGSYILPGKRLSRVRSLSLVLGEGGGHILSCLTPINMWQLMRSKKDF